MTPVDHPSPELPLSYVLKRVQAQMRAGMEEVLRPFNLTVPQYACLELLGRDPGLSNSDLARAAFVTRQSMSLVVRRLQDRGLLTRPGQAVQGRALPIQLTAAGHAVVGEAGGLIRAVEARLFAPLTSQGKEQLRGALMACVTDAPLPPDAD